MALERSFAVLSGLHRLQGRFALIAFATLMSVLVWGGEAPLPDLTKSMSGIDRSRNLGTLGFRFRRPVGRSQRQFVEPLDVRRGLMRKGDPAKDVDVNLTGHKRIELRITDGGNGNTFDHTNWCDARFVYTDSPPQLVLRWTLELPHFSGEAPAAPSKSTVVTSPNGKVAAHVGVSGGRLVLAVQRDGKTVLDPSQHDKLRGSFPFVHRERQRRRQTGDHACTRIQPLPSR